MSDESVELTQAGGGTPVNQQPPSQPAAGVPLEEQVRTLKQELDRTKAMVGSIQSDKDKAAYRAEDLAKVTSQQVLAIAKVLNIDPEKALEAQRQSVLNQMVNERINQSNSQPVAPSGGAEVNTSSGLKLADVDNELGIQPNDPRVTQLKIQYAEDPLRYTIEVAKLSGTINQPSPTPAENPLPERSVATTQTNKSGDALQSEYEAKRDEIARSPQPHPLKLRALTDLKAEYRTKGLNVR